MLIVQQMWHVYAQARALVVGHVGRQKTLGVQPFCETKILEFSVEPAQCACFVPIAARLAVSFIGPAW